MKSLIVAFVFLFLIAPEPLRLELNYDKEAKELQIKVQGKDRIEHVMIYAEDKKLLVEFDSQQIPPWNNMISLKVSCPEPCRFYYVIQTSDGTIHRIKSKNTNLSKHGTFVEIE